MSRFVLADARSFPFFCFFPLRLPCVRDTQGLRFIHDSGVIHLDVKPANVFVTKEGRFKIGDFGMASLWPRPAFLDSTALGAAAPGAGLLLGGGAATAPGGGGGAGGGFEREGDKLYLAPEVLQGRYGKAADMFR